MAFGEVDRRVEVGPSMLRRREIVRRVVVTLLGHAGGDLLQLEGVGGRPEDGLLAVVVRQIDCAACRPRQVIRRSRARRHREREYARQEGFHPAPRTYCDISSPTRLTPFVETKEQLVSW